MTLRHSTTTLVLVALPWGAQAARPMVTDDAAIATRGECQLEVWSDRLDDDRALSIAPACGLTDSLEFDAQATRVQVGGASLYGVGLGLKWAPDGLEFELPVGTLNVAFKAGYAWLRDAAGHWRHDGVGAAALASLAIGPAWSVNANLATVRDLAGRTSTTGFNLGVAWQASERWMLFGEWLATDRAAGVANAGTRWWWVPGTLGLDFSVGRTAAHGATIGVGLGWYGIRFP